jgi:hypothetical protein
MQAPSQEDFRKGRQPGERKPISREKQLAAFLIATRERRQSLLVVGHIWNHLLAMLPEGRLKDAEKLFAERGLFTHDRRKVFWKWEREARFRQLVEEFQRSYAESILDQIEATLSRGPELPLEEIAREIWRLVDIAAQLHKPTNQLFFDDHFTKRFELAYKTDPKAAEALMLAISYVFHAWAERGLLKDVDGWVNSNVFPDAIKNSFLLQRNAVRALVAEPNKEKRAAMGASLHSLLRVREIILRDGLGMIDHRAYVISTMEKPEGAKEKPRRSRRKKPKKRGKG